MNRKEHVLNAVLLSIGLGYVIYPSGDVETFRAIVEIGIPVILGALFPDVDTAFGRHRKTLHNLPILGLFYVFPMYFGNLEYVWIGVLTHFVLDMLGSKRGLALFYPYEREYSIPFGVSVGSASAAGVTLAITLVELVAAIVFVHNQLVVNAAMSVMGI